MSPFLLCAAVATAATVQFLEVDEAAKPRLEIAKSGLYQPDDFDPGTTALFPHPTNPKFSLLKPDGEIMVWPSPVDGTWPPHFEVTAWRFADPYTEHSEAVLEVRDHGVRAGLATHVLDYNLHPTQPVMLVDDLASGQRRFRITDIARSAEVVLPTLPCMTSTEHAMDRRTSTVWSDQQLITATMATRQHAEACVWNIADGSLQARVRVDATPFMNKVLTEFKVMSDGTTLQAYDGPSCTLTYVDMGSRTAKQQTWPAPESDLPRNLVRCEQAEAAWKAETPFTKLAPAFQTVETRSLLGDGGISPHHHNSESRLEVIGVGTDGTLALRFLDKIGDACSYPGMDPGWGVTIQIHDPRRQRHVGMYPIYESQESGRECTTDQEAVAQLTAAKAHMTRLGIDPRSRISVQRWKQENTQQARKGDRFTMSRTNFWHEDMEHVLGYPWKHEGYDEYATVFNIDTSEGHWAIQEARLSVSPSVTIEPWGHFHHTGAAYLVFLPTVQDQAGDYLIHGPFPVLDQM
jgi:hypothetical protein